MRVFQNITEFYVGLEEIGYMNEYNEHVSHFRNIVMGLGGGCGCTKNKRLSLATNMYHQMCNKLTDENKEYIKEKLGVDKVELRDNEETFCSF
jgi:hypothetical protein